MDDEQFIPNNPEFADRVNGQMGLTLRQAIYLNPNADGLSAIIEAALVSLVR